MRNMCSLISLVIAGFFVCVCTGSAVTTPDRALTHVAIETPDSPTVAEQLTLACFDVLEGSITEGRFELIVSDEELKALVDKGLEPEIIAVSRPFRQIQAERPAVLAVPSHYPELAEIIADMNSAQTDYPEICRLVDLTETYGVPGTFEGRHLFAVKISDNVVEDEDEPAYLMVCEHHAREIVTPVVGLYAIEQFTTRYGVDPEITALVDEYEIWIAPVWNPDGYEYVFNVNNMWRKNRRVFQEGVGVDLNRNYPFGWDAPCGGSTDVTSSVYRGPEPGSEAETQTMIAFANDRDFAKVADYHSSGQQVRYGYGCLGYPFDSFLVSEALDLADSVPGYTTTRSCCTAGDIHFQMAVRASHAFLWETHTQFQPTYASARAEAALVLPGVVSFLRRPIPLSGHVTDAYTGQPVSASITYVGINFENGETNNSNERFGRYDAFLPDGTYTLEFSAMGYLTQSHVVDVDASSAAILDVALVPRADMDSDGDVDMVDFTLFSLLWGETGCGACGGADLIGDGSVGVDDLQEFAAHWLAGK
ncbi:MAG: carboxypeptidase regulatory-like domain-containing protein [Phycisphaerales bacterium]|nr:MAG: carboxypeptidase regulatory-like domain-containing protein [Phycisphaerales bacterium]